MSVKLTTFNIRYDAGLDAENNWESRKASVISVLKKNAADLCCFQEVLPHVKRELIQALPEKSFFGPGRTRDLKGESALISFDRATFEAVRADCFWLSPTPDLYGSKFFPDTPHPRICTHLLLRHFASERCFHLFNTHLDNEKLDLIRSGLEVIAKKIASAQSPYPYPVILCGDFNAEPDFILPLLKKLLPSLHDCSDLRTSNPSYTYHEFGKAQKKIDYIFASEEFTCAVPILDTFCQNGVFLSDHYPVSQELTLK